jgi:phosphoribosylformylglycinamidine cyclo-ligase
MPITYRESGINYNLMDAFKNACLSAGGDASEILELEEGYLVDVLEGLGSLSQLADHIYEKTGKDYYYQVGWGNAATILNDLVAVGANPLSMKLFLGAGSENWFAQNSRWENLIKGFKDAAVFCSASWNGGETQTLVNVIENDSIVLAGSSVGIIKPKSNIIQDKNIQEGDAIILLESSGVHTNGITLIRSLFQDDVGVAIQAIENKTIIYAPYLLELLNKKIPLHYASHITGHGWRKIMRSKRDFVYSIENIPKPHTIFSEIKEKAQLSDSQMYSDYNMGAGYMLIVSQEHVDNVLSLAKEFQLKAINSGIVIKGERKVVILPLNITLEGSSLTIR